MILGKGVDGRQYYFRILNSPDRIRIAVESGDGEVTYGPGFNQNQWYFVRAVFADKLLRIFVDDGTGMTQVGQSFGYTQSVQSFIFLSDE